MLILCVLGQGRRVYVERVTSVKVRREKKGTEDEKRMKRKMSRKLSTPALP